MEAPTRAKPVCPVTSRCIGDKNTKGGQVRRVDRAAYLFSFPWVPRMKTDTEEKLQAAAGYKKIVLHNIEEATWGQIEGPNKLDNPGYMNVSLGDVALIVH
jgi:hypothetical protein